jgi:hypothetical protein
VTEESRVTVRDVGGGVDQLRRVHERRITWNNGKPCGLC